MTPAPTSVDDAGRLVAEHDRQERTPTPIMREVAVAQAAVGDLHPDLARARGGDVDVVDDDERLAGLFQQCCTHDMSPSGRCGERFRRRRMTTGESHLITARDRPQAR